MNVDAQNFDKIAVLNRRLFNMRVMCVFTVYSFFRTFDPNSRRKKVYIRKIKSREISSRFSA